MLRVVIMEFGPPFCATPFGPRLPAPVFPEPDQFEIIVFRDDCEQSFFIDVNDETVVVFPPDENFGFPTFELREPLLVDPCVPDASP